MTKRITGYEYAYLDDEATEVFRKWLQRTDNRARKSWSLDSSIASFETPRQVHGVTYRTPIVVRDRIAYGVAWLSMAPDGAEDYVRVARARTGIDKVDWTGKTIREIVGDRPDGCHEYPRGYWAVEYCSNYHGADLLYRANHEALTEMLDEANLIGGPRHESEFDEPQTIEHCPFYHNNGFRSIALNLDVRVYGKRAHDLEQAMETIAGLHNYPLIDDGVHSQMEWDEWTEYVNDQAGRDFQREILKRVDKSIAWDLEEVTDEYDELTDDEELWACINEASVYNEYGLEMYIDDKQWTAIVNVWLDRNEMAVELATLKAGQGMTDDLAEVQRWLRARPAPPTVDEPDLFGRLYYRELA